MVTTSRLNRLAILTVSLISIAALFMTSQNQSCQQNEACQLFLSGPSLTTEIPASLAAPTLGDRYYFVSPYGQDAQAGTKTAPFQTINKAASVAKAGDVILIQAGVYYEHVRPLRSGEPNKYITY